MLFSFLKNAQISILKTESEEKLKFFRNKQTQLCGLICYHCENWKIFLFCIKEPLGFGTISNNNNQNLM